MSNKLRPASEFVLSKEEEAWAEPIIQKWIKNASRTDSMTPEMREICFVAMQQAYKDMNRPPIEREWNFFVRSPVEGAIVAGLLQAAFDKKSKVKSYDMSGILDLIKDLPTEEAPSEKDFVVAPYDLKKIVELSGLKTTALEAIRNAHRMWNGGNQSIAAEAYAEFYRDKVKVHERFLSPSGKPIDFNLWQPYETLALNSGPRYMHTDFVVFCDFFTELHLDERDRPHAENGPYIKWRDGVASYFVHGVRLPAHIITHPENLTADMVNNESNAEIRRIMIDKLGMEKFVRDGGFKTMDEDTDMYDRPRRLLKKTLQDDEDLVLIEVTNSTAEPDGTFKKYLMRVDPNAYNGRASKECKAAIASTWRTKTPGAPLMFATPEEYVLDVET